MRALDSHCLSPLQDYMVCNAGPAVSVSSSRRQANPGCHPTKVMSLGGSVHCSLQAKPFADSALSQVISLSACTPSMALSFSQQSGGESCLRCHAWAVQIAAVAAWEADDSAADGDSSTAVACAAAAQRMLLRLMTETSHGIAAPVMSAVSAPVRDDMSGETFGAGPGYP